MTQTIEEREEGIVFFELPGKQVYLRVDINGEEVSPYVESLQVRRTKIDALSTCDIVLNNYKGRFNNKWNGGETIEVYYDYTDGTTKKYKGKLDNNPRGMNNDGWFMYIESRSYPELIDMKYIGSFTNELGSNAFKVIIDELNSRKATGISYTASSITDTTETINDDFREVSYLEAFKRIKAKIGYDCYIDENGVFYGHPTGSKTLVSPAIVSGINVWSCPRFGKDRRTEINRQRVYGAEQEGCLIEWLEEDLDSQSQTWIKENPVNDSSIINREQAEERAEAEISENGSAEDGGTINCLGMDGLIPAYNIDTFVSYACEGKYIIHEWTDNISADAWDSSIVIGAKGETVISILKEREREIDFLQTFNNPNKMDNSYHFVFDDDSQVSSHSNTETTSGKLRLKTEIADSGTMISINFTLPYSPSYFEIRYNGNDDCDLTTFDVTFNGVDYQENINAGLKGMPGTLTNVTNTGTTMNIKVKMKSDVTHPLPLIDSLGLYIRK